jgi:cystathionine beta-lyase
MGGTGLNRTDPFLNHSLNSLFKKVQESLHNPVSRVWTKEELTELGHICLKYHCLIVSDEIHCDFVYQNRQHHILTTINPALEEIAIILTAPLKTLNLAGLQASNAFIANPELRGGQVE